MNGLYILLIFMGIVVSIVIVILGMNIHDEQIRIDNWQQDVIELTSKETCKTLYDDYLFNALYINEKDKFFKRDQVVFDWMQQRDMECQNAK